jgi:hypothetical protein
MNKSPTEIQSFSQTINCLCGKKFKLRYNKKRKINKTVCPICGKDYDYILKSFLDHEQEIAKLAYDVFYSD